MVSLKKKGQSGFTIVELLIVIVIIGILAGLVVTQILGATAKARDTERKTDLDQIANQLEVYYTKNSGFPKSTDLTDSTWRSKNEMSMGDQNKSLYDPSIAVGTSLASGLPTAAPTGVGNYVYIPGVDGTASTTCVSPTNSSGTANSGTFCNSYTLEAWLENDKAVYTKKNAN